VYDEKSVIPLLLAVFLLIGMLPASTYADSTSEDEPVYPGTEAESSPSDATDEESADDFAASMKETYGVNIIEDIPATPQVHRYLENALAFIGEEVLKSVTSIKRLDIYFRAKKKIRIHWAPADTVLTHTMLYCMRVSQVQRLYMSLCML